MNPVHILLVLALCVPLVAFWPPAQGEAGEDWATHVAKACTSPRYGLRLAAAKRVAEGGDAAVPAIRAWVAQHGANAMPQTLVEAIADATERGDAVLELLREQASDADFYWRASAMRGLALRATPELAELLHRYHDDPAWLMRTHARFGLVRLGDRAPLTAPETDPRARVRLATLALGCGTVPPLQPLLDALADTRTFHDQPFGKRLGLEAHKALKNWLGADFPLADGESFDDRATAIEQVLAAARAKSGQALRTPEPAVDPAVTFAGGIELLSCKSGDVFVRWTADGVVFAGIDASERVNLPVPDWERLQQERAALDLTFAPGVVVCDSVRLFWTPPATDVKVAPAGLPAPIANWLTHLAGSVESAGASRLGRDLRTGLVQFAAR